MKPWISINWIVSAIVWTGCAASHPDVTDPATSTSTRADSAVEAPVGYQHVPGMPVSIPPEMVIPRLGLSVFDPSLNALIAFQFFQSEVPIPAECTVVGRGELLGGQPATISTCVVRESGGRPVRIDVNTEVGQLILMASTVGQTTTTSEDLVARLSSFYVAPEVAALDPEEAVGLDIDLPTGFEFLPTVGSMLIAQRGATLERDLGELRVLPMAVPSQPISDATPLCRAAIEQRGGQVLDVRDVSSAERTTMACVAIGMFDVGGFQNPAQSDQRKFLGIRVFPGVGTVLTIALAPDGQLDALYPEFTRAVTSSRLLR